MSFTVQEVITPNENRRIWQAKKIGRHAGKGTKTITSVWRRVVFADECGECSGCGEPYCTSCNQHYADCSCPGPTQDDEYEYTERKGILYARRK